MQLLAAVSIGLVLLFWLLGVVAGYAAGHIPFEVELELAEGMAPTQVEDGETAAYIKDLSARLAGVMELPDGMTVNVHYSAGDTVNAYATLGGHVVMYRGLLEKLPHENALAMVLAHEIAHIKLRHPIRTLGRGAVLAIGIAMLTGATGNTLGSYVVGEAGVLTALEFSRDQEEAADAEALAAVTRLYGHTGGTAALFRVLLEQERELPIQAPPIEFLRTHPLSEHRIDAIEARALDRRWPLNGDITPLPEFVGSR